MPVSDKNHGGVAVTPAVAPGSGHELLDLGQVLAGAQVAIGAPPGRNCSFYDRWRDQPEMPFGHVFSPPSLMDWSYNTPFPTSLNQPKPSFDLFTCGVLTHAAGVDPVLIGQLMSAFGGKA